MKPIYLLFLFFWSIQSGMAQLDPIPLSIPMTDGMELAGDLYLPNETGEFPTLLIQTPYNKNAFLISGLPLGVGFDITSSEYAFVVVDWRCYFASLPACAIDINRGQDGRDVVEWIAGQSWSNGKIGTWGPSALGSIQFQTAAEKPEHLVCAVPIVVSPQIHYEKYFPGGAARVDYIQFVGTYFGTQGLISANPYHNLIWTLTENGSMYPEDIEVPMLIIGGWFDHNTDDCITMFDTLVSSSDSDVQEEHRLLMGPWTHNKVGNPNQGELNFPGSFNWDDSLALQFFNYHLLDASNEWQNSPKVQYYQMGKNSWEHSESWPPENTITQTLYFDDDHSLRNTIPPYMESSKSYEYDPVDPSPSIGGKTFSSDLFQTNVGPLDISTKVEGRMDNLVFSTSPFNEDLTIQGAIKAKLFFGSDRKDTDIALRLTDVYPNGKSYIIGESFLRLHCRQGFTIADTAYMNPGEVYEIELEFEHLAHTFSAGHQLRIVVTSSNYPRFNRNSNTGGAMYPNGNIDTLVNPLIAMNTLYFGQIYPSSIILPIADEGVANKEIFLNHRIKLYPLPAKEFVFLENLPAWQTMRLFDLQGKQLWSDKRGGQDTYTLNVGHLKAGIYFLEINAIDGKVYSAKVIIENHN